MLATQGLRGGRRLATVSLRATSTKVELTAEQIEKGMEKARKSRKYMQKSVCPDNMAKRSVGSDLHIPENPADMAALSGMPEEQSRRKVVIAQRMNKTLQSGSSFVHQWQITWPNQERWMNPLMGWTSSADPMSSLKLTFDTREEAMAFAERNGWTYEVRKATSKSVRPQGYNLYSHNFLDKRTIEVLKREGHKCTVFDNPGYGESQFFMPLKYHGNGEVAQHGPANTK